VGQAKVGSAVAPATWSPPEGFVAESPAAEALSPDFASERVWTRRAGDLMQQIVEVRTKRPLSLRRFLARWRGSHACALSPMRGPRALSWAGDNESTWSGSCEGGDVFVMHVAQVGRTFFAFQVGQRMGPRPMQGGASLREALGRLLVETPKPPAGA
jgi:hypothetical protein